MNRLYVPQSVGMVQALLALQALERASGETWEMVPAHKVTSLPNEEEGKQILLAGEGVAEVLSALPRYKLPCVLDNPAAVLRGQPCAMPQQDLVARPLRVVAVTACSAGVAHTFMASESLQNAAEQLGYDFAVETQGSVGTTHWLTAERIEQADVVVVAADVKVPLERFWGKRLYCAGTQMAIRDGKALLEEAVREAKLYHGQDSKSALRTEVAQAPARIVAVTSCPTGIVHTFMAAEGLQRAAERLGYAIKIETQGSIGAQNVLTDAEIAQADVVVIAADGKIDLARFAGKRLYCAGTKVAVNNGEGLLQKALTEASIHDMNLTQPKAQSQLNTAHAALNESALSSEAPQPKAGAFVVAITSCPTGVAHTFMAAEGLQLAAEQLGYTIKVETQGSVGAQNVLSAEDIARADVVVIAADTQVTGLERFAGKRLYQTNTKAAIANGQEVLQSALHNASVYQEKSTETHANRQETSTAMGVYKHLMTGVSHMLPFVVAGGLLIALGFALGTYQFGDQGIYVYEDQYRGSLAANVFWLGKAAFALFVPILAGFIAFSIAGRPGLAPAMIGGYLSDQTGAGFLGAIIAGYFAGYLIAGLNRMIRLPRSLDALKPMLLLPLLGTAIVGLSMYYVVAPPVADVLESLKATLEGMQSSSDSVLGAAILGAILGGMMAVDMGGPINKASYMVATALLGTEIYAPMAASMAGGMTPPLAIFFATLFFKNRFTAEEREAGKATGILGLSFITEGAIPFAAKDPLRVIPALMAGSALAGAISMMAGVHLHAPHGGVFVLFIPNAIQGLGYYIVALAAGTALSAMLLGFLKPALSQES